MSWTRLRRTLAVMVLALGTCAGAVGAGQSATAGQGSTGQSGAGDCIAGPDSTYCDTVLAPTA